MYRSVFDDFLKRVLPYKQRKGNCNQNETTTPFAQSPMFIHNRHCKWFTWEKSLVQFYDFVHIFRGIMKNLDGSDVHADSMWCAQLDYVCSAPIPSFTALLLIPLQHQFGNGNSLEISFSFETWEQNLSYKISSLLYSEMAMPWSAILLWKVVN